MATTSEETVRNLKTFGKLLERAERRRAKMVQGMENNPTAQRLSAQIEAAKKELAEMEDAFKEDLKPVDDEIRELRESIRSTWLREDGESLRTKEQTVKLPGIRLQMQMRSNVEIPDEQEFYDRLPKVDPDLRDALLKGYKWDTRGLKQAVNAHGAEKLGLKVTVKPTLNVTVTSDE